MSTEFAIKEPYKFSVEDYFLMTETGVLKLGERTELLDGEIIKMGAINSPCASCVARASFIFITRFADRVIVRSQNPIRLNNYSMPQPDLAILKHRPDFYVSSHPTPEDVLVVIEVSDSTLMYDRNVKAET